MNNMFDTDRNDIEIESMDWDAEFEDNEEFELKEEFEERVSHEDDTFLEDWRQGAEFDTY